MSYQSFPKCLYNEKGHKVFQSPGEVKLVSKSADGKTEQWVDESGQIWYDTNHRDKWTEVVAPPVKNAGDVKDLEEATKEAMKTKAYSIPEKSKK